MSDFLENKEETALPKRKKASNSQKLNSFLSIGDKDNQTKTNELNVKWDQDTYIDEDDEVESTNMLPASGEQEINLGVLNRRQRKQLLKMVGFKKKNIPKTIEHKTGEQLERELKQRRKARKRMRK